MELNASVIIAACRAGAEEAARLAPFLDDLDGWDGADCDTGTNAAATMAARGSVLTNAPWVFIDEAGAGTAPTLALARTRE